MQAEYDSLIDNNTWSLIDEPEDKQVLPENGCIKLSVKQTAKSTSSKPDT